MSAAKTETPARERPSANTCNVTVFPVPVAPVISPWRFANSSVKTSGLKLLPTKIVPSLSNSAMAPFLPDNLPPLSLCRVCRQPLQLRHKLLTLACDHRICRIVSIDHSTGIHMPARVAPCTEVTETPMTRDARIQQLVSTFLHSACAPNFCETNIPSTCRECGAGEGLHGRSHRTSRRHHRRRPHGRGKGRWDHSAIGEIVDAFPGLGQFIRCLMAAAGQERGEFNVLLDQRHRRYRGG